MMTSTHIAPEARSGPSYERQARWRERNQLKVWAHAALRSALKRGLIRQEPCRECGDPNSEAHHPDHRNALDVLWLCRKHHKALHAAENAALQEDAA